MGVSQCTPFYFWFYFFVLGIMNYDSFNISLSSSINSKSELGCYLENVYTVVYLQLTSCMSQVFIRVQDSIIYNQVYGCLLFIFQLHQKTWTVTNVIEILSDNSWGGNHTYFCSFNKTYYKSRVYLEETIKQYNLQLCWSLTQWNFLCHNQDFLLPLISFSKLLMQLPGKIEMI